MKTLLFSSLMALGLGFLACNNSSDNHQDSVDSAKAVNNALKAVQPDASNFAVAAANGGMMEVELGKIAQNNAKNSRVKAFGAMKAKDHSEANTTLKGIASTLNI